MKLKRALLPPMLAALMACSSGQDEAPPLGPPVDLPVMSALPLFWPEGDQPGLLDVEEDRRAPIIAALLPRYRATPLDFLSAESLKGKNLVMLAQPRALQPAELVSLDDWVRGGGRLLIFADPALDWHSNLPLGHPRQPPSVTLLDPLFRHWGLDLVINSSSVSADEEMDLFGSKAQGVGVGRWRIQKKQDCELFGEDVMARCTIGLGRVLLVGDADLLNVSQPGMEDNGGCVLSLLQSLQPSFTHENSEQ